MYVRPGLSQYCRSHRKDFIGLVSGGCSGDTSVKIRVTGEDPMLDWSSAFITLIPPSHHFSFPSPVHHLILASSQAFNSPNHTCTLPPSSACLFTDFKLSAPISCGSVWAPEPVESLWDDFVWGTSCGSVMLIVFDRGERCSGWAMGVKTDKHRLQLHPH